MIAHETGKVVDYAVMSRFCKGCRYTGRRKRCPQMLTSSGGTSTSVMLTSLLVQVPWKQREHWICLDVPWMTKFVQKSDLRWRQQNTHPPTRGTAIRPR